jgi:hypothetical protein
MPKVSQSIDHRGSSDYFANFNDLENDLDGQSSGKNFIEYPFRVFGSWGVCSVHDRKRKTSQPKELATAQVSNGSMIDFQHVQFAQNLTYGQYWKTKHAANWKKPKILYTKLGHQS